MRCWYLTQLIHAQHNVITYHLYKLYKITLRLHQLYLNAINYLLPSTTPATVPHYCKTQHYCLISPASIQRHNAPPSVIPVHCAQRAFRTTWSCTIGQDTSKKQSPTPIYVRAVFCQYRMEMLTKHKKQDGIHFH